MERRLRVYCVASLYITSRPNGPKCNGAGWSLARRLNWATRKKTSDAGVRVDCIFTQSCLTKRYCSRLCLFLYLPHVLILHDP